MILSRTLATKFSKRTLRCRCFSMCSRRLLTEWAVLAVICTAVVFLFPAHVGPFSVVHGPATALRAWDFAVSTFVGIALAASTVLSPQPLSHESSRCSDELIWASALLQTRSSSILRC